MPIAPRVRSLAVGLAKRAVGTERWQAWREVLGLARARSADRRENRCRLRDGPCLTVLSEGRDPHAYREFLDWLVGHDPALRERIRLGRLPAALPPQTRVLHAWVQDPVRERSAQLFDQLSHLEQQARERGVGIIHPAAVLSHSRRDVLYRRLHQQGVRTPRVVPLGPEVMDALDGLELPIMVRRNWGHTLPMVRLDSRAAVKAWGHAQGKGIADWVATEYIDVRSPDGLYRKYRYLMAGNRGLRRHLIVSPNWEVRPKDRVLTDQTIAAELAFVSEPSGEHGLLNQARRALQFEIAAFDYSYDRNGTRVVWEVNPYPDLSRPRGLPGQYLAPTVTRTFQLLAAFYRDALAQAGVAVPPPPTPFDG